MAHNDAQEKGKAETLVTQRRNASAKPLIGRMEKIAQELDELGFPVEARLVNRVHNRLDALVKGINYLDERRKRMLERRKA